jgi:hypothetical protein
MGLFSHETEALSNTPQKSDLVWREPTQNPRLTVKFNQAIPSHALGHGNVQGQNLYAASSLPDAHPLVLGTQDLSQPDEKDGCAVPLAEGLEQCELLIKPVTER